MFPLQGLENNIRNRSTGNITQSSSNENHKDYQGTSTGPGSCNVVRTGKEINHVHPDQLYTQAHIYALIRKIFRKKICPTKRLDAFLFACQHDQMISLSREENDSHQVSM